MLFEMNSLNLNRTLQIWSSSMKQVIVHPLTVDQYAPHTLPSPTTVFGLALPST